MYVVLVSAVAHAQFLGASSLRGPRPSVMLTFCMARAPSQVPVTILARAHALVLVDFLACCVSTTPSRSDPGARLHAGPCLREKRPAVRPAGRSFPSTGKPLGYWEPSGVCSRPIKQE